MGSERALGMEQCGGGISHFFWRPDCGGCGTRSWHVNEMKQNCVDAAMVHKYAEDWYFQSSFDMCWYGTVFWRDGTGNNVVYCLDNCYPSSHYTHRGKLAFGLGGTAVGGCSAQISSKKRMVSAMKYAGWW